jgi:hypothetical protein
MTPCKLEPVINYLPYRDKVELLPSAFPPLTCEELQQDWGRELRVADAFARDLDLYRAITAYKRALILLPENLWDRRLQIQYSIILCYYLGNKYQEAVETFEESDLLNIQINFPAISTLLILLYDSYLQLDQPEKAERVMEIIEKCSDETARDLNLYTAIIEGDLPCVNALIEEHPASATFQPYFYDYCVEAKSVRKARMLNALLPGAGYLYVGQKKSALTSLIINALFIFATYELFHHGYPAGGVITGSLEAGWYFGGINGAGIEAQVYNNRIYEMNFRGMLEKNGLFPVLMFETAF